MVSHSSPKTGVDLIKQLVRTLPNRPGVYRMVDTAGQVLYVGKARDLKQRVNNYTSLAGKNQRLATMIMQTAAMEFVVTRNEAEALLLEANLIKSLEPRYNILLRDGKSFPMLLITAHDFPRVQKYRGPKDDSKGQYFGPFPSAGDLNQTITQLQKLFLLRPCSDNYFESRSRPCLQYQIKRCSAPCVDYVSKPDYAKLVTQAKQFMCGERQDMQAALLRDMQDASEAMQYERAALLRDRVKALTQIQQQQGLQLPSVREADILALTLREGVACVQLFFFREGMHYGNQSYFLKQTADQDEAEILAAFIMQFYQRHDIAKTILVSHSIEGRELIQEALSAQAGRAVRLIVPQRGDKAEVMKQALQNAELALQRHLANNASQRELLQKVAELFELPAPPARIEVYDNSHISGTNAIGAMIVAGVDGFIKNEYRKFTIKQAGTDDDYAMMREVLHRRLSRWQKESGQAGTDDAEATRPDLLLIDGGAGQLSAVREVMETLNLWGIIPVVAIAKGVDRNAGREKFFVPGKPMFQLPEHDAVLHYLQRLRDEAHRFAIGTHRAKRSSQLTRSQLDEIAGIGAKRKKALLHYFGSARAVANASKAELQCVEGISQAVATQIWNHFHGGA